MREEKEEENLPQTHTVPQCRRNTTNYRDNVIDCRANEQAAQLSRLQQTFFYHEELLRLLNHPGFSTHFQNKAHIKHTQYSRHEDNTFTVDEIGLNLRLCSLPRAMLLPCPCILENNIVRCNTAFSVFAFYINYCSNEKTTKRNDEHESRPPTSPGTS